MHEPAHLQIAQRRFLIVGTRSRTCRAKSSRRKSGARLAEPHRVVGRLVAAALADREQQLQQLVLHARRDARHHPEVDEREPAVRGDEEIAGMRIGVEEPVREHLVEVGLEEHVGEVRARRTPAGRSGSGP